MIGTDKVKAMVAILRTKGCWWAFQKGCTMCGYNVESDQGITIEDLRAQLASVKGKYSGEPMVKIYTSGSFLDEREIPSELRLEILGAFPQAQKIIFETRPEFVTDEALESLPKEKVLVALGLESADDEVLRRSIRKGFTVADYCQGSGEPEASLHPGEDLSVAQTAVHDRGPRRSATPPPPSSSPGSTRKAYPSTRSTSSPGPSSRTCGGGATTGRPGYGRWWKC